MSRFIQVGTTAMRDPATGGFLESVPLYIRAEDQKKVEPVVIDDSALRMLAEKFAAYQREAKKAKKKAV